MKKWALVILAVSSGSCAFAGTDALPYAGKLLFQSNRNGNEEIYLRDEHGVIKNLTNNPADDTYPSWSPDGKRIMFVSNRDTNLEYVYQMKPDGSNVTKLLSDARGPVTYPHFSCDGKKIIFTGPYARARDSIYIYDRASRQVTGPVGPYGARCEWGQLSPDGNTVTYNHFIKPSGAGVPWGWFVEIRDLTTGVVTTIDTGCEPFFSKDGSKLLYVHFANSNDTTSLHVYDMVTKINKRYTDMTGFPYSPRFTRDGKWIVFAQSPERDVINEYELYMMPSIPFAAPIRITANSSEDRYPDFY